MKVTVKKEITSLVNDFNVVAFSFDISVNETNDEIKNVIKSYEERYSKISLEEVINLEKIKEARDGYKKFGKDPSRYRVACESLLRRLVKGMGLYIINNAVDIGNILSIDLNRSVAVLDYDKIEGDVEIRMGRVDDEYYGIGRGLINVSNIPVYCDNVCPFGSPTSDTLRTSITNDTKKVLLFVICFSKKDVKESKEKAIELFKELGKATSFEDIEVVYE